MNAQRVQLDTEGPFHQRRRDEGDIPQEEEFDHQYQQQNK